MTFLVNLGVWLQPRGLGNFDIGSRTSVRIKAGRLLPGIVNMASRGRTSYGASFIRPVLGILCVPL